MNITNRQKALIKPYFEQGKTVVETFRILLDIGTRVPLEIIQHYYISRHTERKQYE